MYFIIPVGKLQLIIVFLHFFVILGKQLRWNAGEYAILLSMTNRTTFGARFSLMEQFFYSKHVKLKVRSLSFDSITVPKCAVWTRIFHWSMFVKVVKKNDRNALVYYLGLELTQKLICTAVSQIGDKLNWNMSGKVWTQKKIENILSLEKTTYSYQ